MWSQRGVLVVFVFKGSKETVAEE